MFLGKLDSHMQSNEIETIQKFIQSWLKSSRLDQNLQNVLRKHRKISSGNGPQR